MIYEYYTLDPEAFSQKMDSLRSEKIEHLKELEEDFQFSEKVSPLPRLP